MRRQPPKVEPSVERDASSFGTRDGARKRVTPEPDGMGAIPYDPDAWDYDSRDPESERKPFPWGTAPTFDGRNSYPPGHETQARKGALSRDLADDLPVRDAKPFGGGR